MLSITCLSGPLAGKNFSIFEGLRLSNDKNDDICLDDISNGHYLIELNSEGLLTLTAKDKAEALESAGENAKNLILIPGLIFSIGDSTFAVQEAEENIRPPKQGDKGENTFLDLAKALINGPECDEELKPIRILETPIKIDFVRGFWMNQSWLLQHSPIHFGRKSHIYFFPDESIDTEKDFLSLEYQADTKTHYFSTEFENLVLINGTAISNQQEIFDGDLVEFGNTAFYININE